MHVLFVCHASLSSSFSLTECKWKLGISVIINTVWVAEESLVGSRSMLDPQVFKGTSLHLEENALPLTQGDPDFYCSCNESMSVFSYYILISLCCFCLVKGFCLLEMKEEWCIELNDYYN